LKNFSITDSICTNVFLQASFLSTFFLDKKSGAKKSRTAQSLRVPVRACAQLPVIAGEKHSLCAQFFFSVFLMTFFCCVQFILMLIKHDTAGALFRLAFNKA
jgi:hypothetical protein